MRQFFAILGDSFREAVDGFVIYAMLGLSALTMLIVGSMSFTPAPPEEAFDKITHDFFMIPSERGRGAHGVGNSDFDASDVTEAGGGYRFRLNVKAQSSGSTFRDGKQIHNPSSGDTFRAAVGTWLSQRDRRDDGSFSTPNPDKQRAITDAQMEEFLTRQFRVRAAMPATVKRVPGVEEPVYAFDVTTEGGSGVRGWPHTTKIFFGAVTVSRRGTLGQTLFVIEDRIINGLGAGVALLVGVIITAFFIPNMLRKGSLDLIIAKPIGRTPLLLYKYVGGLTFIFLVSTVTIGGVWLVIALRSGYWDPTFLVLIPVLTFTFAILYSVSVLLGVLTRSPIVAMLGTIVFMFLVWLAGWGKTIVDLMKAEGDDDEMPGWLVGIINAANTVLPRYKDLDTITSKLIIDGTLTPYEAPMATPVALIPYPDWGTTVGVSLAFIAVMLALACWRFNRRDS
jgi:ABC-type transport system involved in multi-copper enzyme maturation permease subunit